MRSWPPLADPCAYCGGPSDTHDHIRALGEGGLDSWHNLTAACQGCNGRKGRRSVLGFIVGLPDEMTAALMTVPRKHRHTCHRIRSAKRIRRAHQTRREAVKVAKREKALYPPETKLIRLLNAMIVAKAAAAYRAERRQSAKTGTIRRRK